MGHEEYVDWVLCGTVLFLLKEIFLCLTALLMHFGSTWPTFLMSPLTDPWALADRCCVVLACFC